MRIALISPYSWTYPGGVTSHIQGLAETFLRAGHDVTVMAPVDPPGTIARVMHLGAAPSRMRTPAHVNSLGRTAGIRINGALSALSVSPSGLFRLARDLRHGHFDVVHVHEPDAPPVGWVALLSARAPLVGTFHTYNEHLPSHWVGTALGVRLVLNHLHMRIAVSEAAAWTGQRFFGGRYRTIPNGVDLQAARAAEAVSKSRELLTIVFVGQPVARKGLPVLLRAFESIRPTIPAELVLVGPESKDLEGLLDDRTGVHALGKVDDGRKFEALRTADVLCAPSLGGESFGMVLTEAFAAGVPVVASDIPGYRDLVHHKVDGLLFAPGDSRALADALRWMWAEPQARADMAAAAASAADRFAWPVVAEQVLGAYQDAMQVPDPKDRWHKIGARLGVRPADQQPREPAKRLPSLDHRSTSWQRRSPARPRLVRRVATGAAWLVVAVLAVLAVQKMGLHNVAAALGRANVGAAVGAVALMCASMALRAVAWHASLEAALPEEGIRLTDAARGLFIGVLVSSTLPANLGEPSRALVVARKTSTPWKNITMIAGTLMSQTLLNAVALVVLGVITFVSADLFGHFQVAVGAALATAVVLTAALLGSPRLLRRAKEGSWLAKLRRILSEVRAGLTVFRLPRLGAIAVTSMLSAWAVQCAAVYVMLVALHLGQPGGLAAAAAILFAINLTMLLPITPGDLGVFQAATAFVLNAGWGVAYSRGVAYGVVLQAGELAAALLLGVPALLREGLSWRAVARGGMDEIQQIEAGSEPPEPGRD